MSEKLRVYELAKEMLTDSKVIMRIMAQMGIEAKNHMSTLDQPTAQKIRDVLTGKVKLRSDVKEEPRVEAVKARSPQPRPGTAPGQEPTRTAERTTPSAQPSIRPATRPAERQTWFGATRPVTRSERPSPEKAVPQAPVRNSYAQVPQPGPGVRSNPAPAYGIRPSWGATTLGPVIGPRPYTPSPVRPLVPKPARPATPVIRGTEQRATTGDQPAGAPKSLNSEPRGPVEVEAPAKGPEPPVEPLVHQPEAGGAEVKAVPDKSVPEATQREEQVVTVIERPAESEERQTIVSVPPVDIATAVETTPDAQAAEPRSVQDKTASGRVAGEPEVKKRLASETGVQAVPGRQAAQTQPKSDTRVMQDRSVSQAVPRRPAGQDMRSRPDYRERRFETQDRQRQAPAQGYTRGPSPGGARPGTGQGYRGPREGARGFARPQVVIPPPPVVPEQQPARAGGVRAKQKPASDQYEYSRERRQHAEEGQRLSKLRKGYSPKAEIRRSTEPPREVVIDGPIIVKDLASKMALPVTELIKRLLNLGVMVTINQELDPDTAQVIGVELGIPVRYKPPELSAEEKLEAEAQEEDAPEVLEPRPPVVTVMGHVDHGKTSLLDAIRETNVAASEAGGITQHIGASVVEIDGRKVVFLDTPGHEAFTAMRARGAEVTDIAVLVVAADDGVMPQTVEAINHAKAAKVPIVVALNKIDKPNANPELVKKQLAEHGLIPEEWGGETIVVPVSARQKKGIDDLLEMILLTAEMEELRANPNRPARGYVIESQLDKGRGPVATVLVQNGTLHVGDAFVTGTTYGRVRAMMDDKGRRVKKAGPSTPVEVVGLTELPQAGDVFQVVQDERIAKEIAQQRAMRKRASEMETTHKATLEDLFHMAKEGEVRDLNLVVKADVQGSLEALRKAIEGIKSEEVRLNIVHEGVGGINESDVMLASASNAIILGFNVRPDSGARRVAETEKVEIKTYRVIYDAIDDIKAALSGMQKPKMQEVTYGRAEVRALFKVPKVGTVAGCYVTDGKAIRGASVRVIRDGIVIHEGKIASLKRFKDDAREVSAGFECGIGLDRFQDLKEGDVLEFFGEEEVKTE